MAAAVTMTAIVIVVWIAGNMDRGLDITDESYYLVSAIWSDNVSSRFISMRVVPRTLIGVLIKLGISSTTPFRASLSNRCVKYIPPTPNAPAVAQAPKGVATMAAAKPN